MSNIGIVSGIKAQDESLTSVTERKENTNKPANELTAVTDKAALSNLLPRLKGVLDAIDHPTGNILQSMNNNILSLQDAFVEAMQETINGEGIDFANTVTLRLNEQNSLVVNGEHPNKEKLDDLMSKRPELSAAFKEIATQSELLRDVSNIGNVIGKHSGSSAYQSALNMQQHANYQFSIKGEMSHFYFSR